MENQRKKILVVEDDTEIIGSIKEGLELHRYEMIGSAVSGEQALSMLEKKNPDLILMDIQLMGDIDGVETLQMLREAARQALDLDEGTTDVAGPRPTIENRRRPARAGGHEGFEGMGTEQRAPTPPHHPFGNRVLERLPVHFFL